MKNYVTLNIPQTWHSLLLLRLTLEQMARNVDTIKSATEAVFILKFKTTTTYCSAKRSRSITEFFFSPWLFVHQQMMSFKSCVQQEKEKKVPVKLVNVWTCYISLVYVLCIIIVSWYVHFKGAIRTVTIVQFCSVIMTIVHLCSVTMYRNLDDCNFFLLICRNRDACTFFLSIFVGTVMTFGSCSPFK